MGSNKYISVVQDYLQSITDDEFAPLTIRMLQKSNPGLSVETLAPLPTEGVLLDSVFYRTVALQEKKPVKINSLIPGKENKFSFVTILTNKLEMFDSKTKSTLNKHLPNVVFNFWGLTEISYKLVAFTLEELKYILGPAASTLLSYVQVSFNEASNRQILNQIFEFLFTAPIPDDFKFPQDDDNILIHIDRKIPLNFGRYHVKRVRDMYLNCFSNILLVEQFIRFQLSIDRRKAFALLERIHSSFCQIVGVKDHHNIVHHVDNIDLLARTLLPKNLSSEDETEYMLNAKAIVLFFFEVCEYGAKYPLEEKSLFEQE